MKRVIPLESNRKPQYRVGVLGNPPYYDPLELHVHRWVSGRVVEQFPKKPCRIEEGHPQYGRCGVCQYRCVLKDYPRWREYCSICHMVRKPLRRVPPRQESPPPWESLRVERVLPPPPTPLKPPRILPRKIPREGDRIWFWRVDGVSMEGSVLWIWDGELVRIKDSVGGHWLIPLHQVIGPKEDPPLPPKKKNLPPPLPPTRWNGIRPYFLLPKHIIQGDYAIVVPNGVKPPPKESSPGIGSTPYPRRTKKDRKTYWNIS